MAISSTEIKCQILPRDSISRSYYIGSRGLRRDYWFNITGSSVSALTGIANYPNLPDSSNIVLDGFKAPTNLGDNYGQRIYGYFRAPTTGNYTFYMVSDDQAQLWLSSGTDPSNKTLLITNCKFSQNLS